MNNQVKTIYLHAGMPKTASTSIQDTLDINRNLLMQMGYLYPYNHTENYGALFYTKFLEEPEKYFRSIKNNRSRKDCEKICKKSHESLVKDLETSKCDKVIFSGEVFSLMPEEMLRKTKEYLKSLMPESEIKVILYTREISDYINSYIQERIKEKGDVGNIYNNHNKYEKALSKLSKVFGKNNITVHKFEDTFVHKYGPVGHLCDLLGLSDNEVEKLNIIRTNEGIKDIPIDMISYINTIFPMLKDQKLNENRTYIDLDPIRNLSGNKFVLPIETRKKIRENSKEDILWLKENFSIDYSNEPVYQEPSEMIFDEVFEKEMKNASGKLSKTVLILTYSYFEYKLDNSNLDSISIKTFNNLIEYYNENYMNIFSKNSTKQMLEKYKKIIQKRKKRIDTLEELKTNISKNKKHDEANYYRDIAIFCEKHNKIEAAKSFMEIAKLYKPYTESISKRYDKYSELFEKKEILKAQKEEASNVSLVRKVARKFKKNVKKVLNK